MNAFLRISITALALLTTTQAAYATIDSELNDQMSSSLQIALEKSGDSESLKEAMAKFSTGSEKGKGGARDVGLNYLGLPRGVDYSTEGARVLLEEAQAAKNLEAAQCNWQLRQDQLHRKLVAAILQLAAGIGSKSLSTESNQKNSEALNSLQELVGGEEAAKIAESIISWTQAAHVTSDAFEQPRWNFSALHAKQNEVLRMAEHNDFAVIGVESKLHNYGNQTKRKSRATKLVEGTVSAVTMFGPGFGTPIAAQAVGAMYGVSNGGSEEAKLLKEVYYGKQLESRRSALKDETDLVLNAHQEALREHNVPLLVCSEAMLAQLVGALGIPQVLDKPVLNHGTFAQPAFASVDAGM